MDPPDALESSPPSTSNSQLATLLSETYREVDSLKKELSIARKRAEKAERLVQSLTSDSTGSPHPNGDQKHLLTTKMIEDYEDRVSQAELARDEAEARRRAIQESWEHVEEYLALVESRAKDARVAFSRISEGSVAPFVLPPLPQHISSSLSTYPPTSSSQIMAPPNVPARSRSYRAFPALPPHPIPNPNPNLSPTGGTRRPRTPSMDGMYNAAQPPPKRSRANTDDQRAREPRLTYSDSYVSSMQQPHHLQEQGLARIRQQQLMQRSQAPRIIKYADPHVQHPSQRPDAHGHSRSSSTSSLDVDEMLLRATTGDEHGGGAPNGTGTPYLDSPHQLHHNINQRRRPEREGDSPRPHSANNNNIHPGHITTATNPYPPQHPSNVTYPANQSMPVMSSMRAPTQNQVIQTHIFAPVVTGAPTKKTKFPNTIQAGPGSGVGLPGPSLDAGLTPAVTVPFASTNAQGQRICRQCGMVGRYKDGKCVEKWGPGPMGPGTVCDRCRKKMKRVERRGTLENQQQQAANQSVQQQQQQQHQPRSTSHTNMPLSQSSDRSIHRSDTIPTHQQSNNPSGFSQTQSYPQSTRDRDTSSSSHTQSNIRSSLSNVQPSSAVAHSMKNGINQRPQPPQSPPPSIAALKEPQDDDNERNDPDQLPISNVGRGGSGAPSRSNSRNARVRGGTGTRPTPPVTRSSDLSPNANTKKSALGSSSFAVAGGDVGSGSPNMAMEVDEMDADADADAEAEAEVESEAEAEILGAVAATSRDRTDGEEDGADDGDGEADPDADAELLEAVDAAEANSSSSHGGERMRVKSES